MNSRFIKRKTHIPPYDSILVSNLRNNELSRMIITNDQWQIQYYSAPHIVTFHEKSTLIVPQPKSTIVKTCTEP